MLKRAAQTADIESEYDFIFVTLALSLSYSNIEPFVKSMSILPMFIMAQNRGIHMGITQREFYTEVFRWALCAERTNRVLDYYALKQGMKRVQLTVPDDSLTVSTLCVNVETEHERIIERGLFIFTSLLTSLDLMSVRKADPSSESLDTWSSDVDSLILFFRCSHPHNIGCNKIVVNELFKKMGLGKEDFIAAASKEPVDVCVMHFRSMLSHMKEIGVGEFTKKLRRVMDKCIGSLVLWNIWLVMVPCLLVKESKEYWKSLLSNQWGAHLARCMSSWTSNIGLQFVDIHSQEEDEVSNKRKQQPIPPSSDEEEEEETKDKCFGLDQDDNLEYSPPSCNSEGDGNESLAKIQMKSLVTGSWRRSDLLFIDSFILPDSFSCRINPMLGELIRHASHAGRKNYITVSDSVAELNLS